MGSVLITVASAATVAAALVLWRIWPALKGKTTKNDSVQSRVEKWNRYMAPLFRRHVKDELLVAHAHHFVSEDTGKVETLSTWALEPTILPDVDHIAMAHAPNPDANIEIAGFIAIDRLREIFVDNIQPQSLFGHRAWICVWPEDVAISDLGKHLIAVDDFRARHGIHGDPEDKKDE